MQRIFTLAMTVSALALLALLSPAEADEPRYVPAAQTEATYRLLFTISFGGHETTLGQIYRMTVTASDGKTAEGTITPLALIYRCPGEETSKDCQQARNFPGMTRDGDMITMPVPPEIAANLGKLGKITAHDFLQATQVFPMPGPADTENVDKPSMGEKPLFLQTTSVECDESLTKGFFPLGVAAQFTVPCKTTLERSESRLPAAKDGKFSEEMKMALSFAGREHIAVPAGDFAVAEVKYKSAPVSGNATSAEGEWAIAENLGISVRNSVLVHFPNSQNTTHLTRELLKLGP